MATEAIADEPEVEAVDLGDMEEHIRSIVDRLRPVVAQAQKDTKDGAQERLREERAWAEATTTGDRVKRVVLERDRAVRAAERDGGLSREGKDIAISKAHRACADGLTRIGNDLEVALFLLVDRYSADLMPKVDDAVQRDAIAFLLAAPNMLPEQVLQEAADTLSVAVNPETSDTARGKASAAWSKSYGRILPRWASLSAPKYVAGWQSLARELVDLGEAHLDTVANGPMKRAVEQFVAQARSDWTWLRNTVERESEWADPFLTGVPLLTGEIEALNEAA